MGIFKKNINMNDIKKVEKDFNLSLPRDYIDYILDNNGKGFSNVFVLYKGEEIPYSRNVSLNRRDKYCIYDLYGKVIDKKYFPFADNGFGDYFCIDLKNDKIVLWNHELNNYVYIEESFAKFIVNLKVEEK